MAKKKPYQLGKDARKIDPKLRMIANGSGEVNIARAEQCAGIAVDARRRVPVNLAYDEDLWLAEKHGPPPRGTVRTPSEAILANVFVATDSPEVLSQAGVGESARAGLLVTTTIPLSKLKGLAAQRGVHSISLGQQLKDPTPSVSLQKPLEPDPELRRIAGAELHKDGEGVLVGVIDVQGFDFAHPDFLDAAGRTRFEAIWDQGAKGDGTAPQPYGRVISKDQMNRALVDAPAVGAPATELEPQTQMRPHSHGTHVASIAAGNRGIARKARIAAVLVSLGEEDVDPRRSFYDSTRLAHAVNYLVKLAGDLKLELAINISLGTNGHAHDESAPLNRWIDNVLISSGRSVCVAAGNAGQEKSFGADDYGFVMGRIHTAGRIPAAGLDADIEWTVAGRGGHDYSENELGFWFSPQDRLDISVRTPDGTWLGPVRPREFLENRRLADGSFVSIYNELYHASNGCNYIGVYLTPNYKAMPIIGVKAGTWLVRLHGREIRNGNYHGWIERDDPRELPGKPGEPAPLAYPSFFTEKSNVDRSSVSTLACGQRVVSVANLDDVTERINVTSSQGPTRDERNKPEICAPGTNIVAASGFTGSSERWVSMSGTSMASPYVCGVTALMLAVNDKLTAAQIGGILQRTARPLPGGNFPWQNDSGYGRINPAACVREAHSFTDRVDRT